MKNRKNNKGFSLVELIVVIAIMAIMVGVLAPTLMRYVEKARVSKDISALGEVKNAITLAAAEETIFNEIRDASTTGVSIVVSMDATSKKYTFKDGKDTNNKGSKLENEVAKTISEIELTSSGLKSATVTFKAEENNGAVKITVTQTGATGEAITPFAEAFN